MNWVYLSVGYNVENGAGRPFLRAPRDHHRTDMPLQLGGSFDMVKEYIWPLGLVRLSCEVDAFEQVPGAAQQPGSADGCANRQGCSSPMLVLARSKLVDNMLDDLQR